MQVFTTVFGQFCFNTRFRIKRAANEHMVVKPGGTLTNQRLKFDGDVWMVSILIHVNANYLKIVNGREINFCGLCGMI